MSEHTDTTFCIFDTNASSANLVSVCDDDFFHIRGFHLRNLCVSKTVTDFLGCLSTPILDTLFLTLMSANLC